MKTNFFSKIQFGKVAKMFLLFLLFIKCPLSAQILKLPFRIPPIFRPNQQSHNKSSGKDTAAVLNFNDKPANQFTSSSVQDISGIWEGEQSNGTLIMYYKLALNHLNGNTYSGYDYCVWEKYIDHKPINAKDGVMPNAKKSFLGSFENAEFNFTEIGQLENSTWGLISEKFKIVDDNGMPAIINDNNQPQRKFYLKRTSTNFSAS